MVARSNALNSLQSEPRYSHPATSYELDNPLGQSTSTLSELGKTFSDPVCDTENSGIIFVVSHPHAGHRSTRISIIYALCTRWLVQRPKCRLCASGGGGGLVSDKRSQNNPSR